MRRPNLHWFEIRWLDELVLDSGVNMKRAAELIGASYSCVKSHYHRCGGVMNARRYQG